MIFDEKRFDKPYLSLDLRHVVDLKGNYPRGFEHLKKAFRDNMIENAAIERLWFGGIFVQLLLFGSEENHGFIGPRGTKRSSFDVYFREKEGPIVKAFTYSGQEELDYSIFTENCIYFFEGKNTPAKRVECTPKSGHIDNVQQSPAGQEGAPWFGDNSLVSSR